MAYTTISKSSDYFNTKLWTGTGSSNAITGVGFQPDFCWVKSRSLTENHFLNNAINGSTRVRQSDTNAAEQTSSNGMTSFNSDGFTVNTDTGFNGNGATYVAWNWKANGAGSSNSDGDITSTVSANTTSGVSIIKFTGNSSTSQSFGHGLNGTPKIWFIKNISVSGDNWQVYIDGIRLKLDTTEVGEANYLMTANATTITTPSSGGAGWGNYNGQDFLVYAFQNIQGFSKAGSYVGNGEPAGDAPFIYTGFKPAFVLLRSSTYAESWSITDNKRLGYNGSSAFLKADASQAEATDLVNPDLLSNGFSLQNNDNVYNKNGQSYIYMAFAEEPLVSSNDVAATAR